jgi:hypothetical protein
MIAQLLASSLSQVCSNEWINERRSNGIFENSGSGCAIVRGCYLYSVTAWQGGAVLLISFSEISVSDCSFRECTAKRDLEILGCGGACDLGATQVRLWRCCGLSCKDEGSGQFLSLDSAGSSAADSPDSHAISELTVLQCGGTNYADDSGTLSVEPNVAASFREVNTTACKVYSKLLRLLSPRTNAKSPGDKNGLNGIRSSESRVRWVSNPN